MIRVALADDHEMVRLGLAMLLGEMEGVSLVGEASSGPDAVALCRAARPDVLLLDLALPGLDGVGVLRAVVAEGSVPAVVMLTSLASGEQIRAALDAGARGFLFKDTDRERLDVAIRAAASGQTVLHPEAQAALIRIAADAPEDALTPRERAILQALARGRSNKEIAAEMGLTLGTVKVYVTRVLAKLGVEDRTQAALYAQRRAINQS